MKYISPFLVLVSLALICTTHALTLSKPRSSVARASARTHQRITVRLHPHVDREDTGQATSSRLAPSHTRQHVVNGESTQVTWDYTGGPTSVDVPPTPDGSFPGSRDSGVSLAVPRTCPNPGNGTGQDYVLYGGFGPDINGTIGWLPDTWVKDGCTGQWRRVQAAGPYVANCAGRYPPTPGQSKCQGGPCFPGSRSGASLYQYEDNPAWYILWAGFGYGADQSRGRGKLSDMWVLDTTNQRYTWTYIAGPQNIGAIGSYGTKGLPNNSNWPGGRVGHASWRGQQRNEFYIFGGWGYGTDPKVRGALSDVWSCHVTLTAVGNGAGIAATHSWVWVSGPSLANAPGVYPPSAVVGPNPTPSPQPPPLAQPYNPCGRYGLTWWSPSTADGQASGDMWVFGGWARDNNYNLGYINDLWFFNYTTAAWTWINGQVYINGTGDYGIQGVAAPSNQPPPRYNGQAWLGQGEDSNNLYMFGGSNHSDVWVLNAETHLWTWLAGPSSPDQPGVYPSTPPSPSPAEWPGARYGAYVWPGPTAGQFFYFGGFGNASPVNPTPGGLCDEWMLTIRNVS